MVTLTKMKNGESARDHTRLRTQRKRPTCGNRLLVKSSSMHKSVSNTSAYIIHTL